MECPFLSRRAALIARAGVRCTACVGVRERAVSDYSGRFRYHFSSAEKDAEVENRTGRQTWRPERVVRAARCISVDAATRGDCAGGGMAVVAPFLFRST